MDDWHRYRSIGKKVLGWGGIAIVVGMIFVAGMVTQRWLLFSTDQIATTQANNADSPMSAESFASFVFIETNRERLIAGLAPLQRSDQLDQSATTKLDHLLAHGYWDHDAPDGTTPWDFMTAAGYRFVLAGENLARDFTQPQDVVDGWMNSSSHRENILSPVFTDTGIAVRWVNPGWHPSWTVTAHYGSAR